MHIAKTAGSKVNSIFKEFVQPDSYLEHCEFHLDTFQKASSEKVYLSGHVFYKKVAKHLENHYKFTVIRNGISHLASHILWLDHYNLPEKKAELARLSNNIQDVVYQIKETNLLDYKELDFFLTNLDETGVKLLDNCQSRYFLNIEREINMSDIPEIIRVASVFDRVIFQENFVLGMNNVLSDISSEKLYSADSLSERVNEKKSARAINIEVPIVKQVLSRRCMVDDRMYNMLRAKG